MNAFLEAIVTVIGSIIFLAIVATLVSRNANTTGVIQAGASGLANNIGVAQSPVTGAKLHLSLGYPSDNNLGYMMGG